ncbi:PAS domain S-box protein [Paenibacillus sp. 1011MAR3C5]|uniref:ATP-binding protein n=1 Tax=Paenibacillus sp. 1011MAR3C5 TaxID=1675787 RepID=UPI000E6CAADD|nr:ATP-binding protein [Paenibacillus sp. 1011MAR3C5]RJE84258.1 PAS domain S-box protein [Paenibacillus sp. 1011MAR3C5]
MSHPILFGNPYYLLLSLSIMCFASFTMMSFDHMRPKAGLQSIYWMLGAALVFSLGLWTMHVVSMMASDYMLVVDWSMMVTFFACVVTTFAALYIIFRKADISRLCEGIAAFILACSSMLLHYMSILSNSIQAYSIHYGWFVLSFAVSFAGAYTAILLLKKKPSFYKMINALVLGISSMAMHQIGMHAITVQYRDIMTMERFNEYLLLLAFILCMTTFLIISFSLTTWFNIKKFAVIHGRYKLLVENSMDTIALIKDGKWEYMNPSGLALFDARHERELIGASVYELLEPNHHDDIAEWMDAELPADGAPALTTELRWRTLRGKLIHTEMVRVRASFYGAPVEQVIIRDISERKKNEELLIKAEKLSIAGQLAAGIAHEIRNPLTSLKGFMQLLSSGRIHNSHYYAIMKSDLIQIESIISELLMLSKPQVYEYAHIDLQQLLTEAVSSLRAHADMYRVRLEYGQVQHPLWVMGVGTQLKQVFINVIKNAIESMQDGGTVRVDVCVSDRGMTIIRIRDEGMGISKEQLAKMGQPFYTTKEKGTGLGLMVSYKIIDNHEGFISAESELGIGTTFTIRLPQRCPAAGKLELLNRHA